MTILFAGGEDTSFALIGSVAVNTSGLAGVYRSTYARCALNMQGSAADPPANRIQTPVFTAVSTIWAHARVGNGSSGNATTSAVQMLRLLDGGVARILVRGTGTAGQLKVSKRNSAGTITDLVTGTSGLMTGLSSSTVQIDLQVIVSASGTINLYIDSVLAATFSGDTTTDSNTTLNQMELADWSTSFNSDWSEVIAADVDTRAMNLWSLSPQAAGNTQSWTPNTLANISKTTINDATLISTASNNALSEWTTPTSPPAGTWDVKAIVQEARVSVGATGPQHFDWVVRTGGSDFTAGLSLAPSNTLSNFGNQIWATNPNTSGAWAIGDIASGFNLGIKSLA
jgi:hypothetical protein